MTTKQEQTIGMKVTVQGDIESVQARVAEALKTEGFGILTEINVQNTLKQKINVDFRPYKILGACNPHLAHRALELAPEVGLLLPCNVTLSQVTEGEIEVSIIDPIGMMSFMNHAELTPVADEARERLQRVIKLLEA